MLLPDHLLCSYHFCYKQPLSISDYEAVVKLSEDFNGADLRNVCTEAGDDHEQAKLANVNLPN